MAIVYKLKSPGGLSISMNAPNNSAKVSSSIVPNLRCPHCQHMGAFTTVVEQDLRIQHIEKRNGSPFEEGQSTIGIRVCPNADCRGVVMVVVDKNGKVVALPNEVLDFDSTDIPPSIASSLEEAVKCHSAQCYKAAALMVRRVLEELCEERDAKGKNLKERLDALSKLIIVPEALLKAADHLRLLGNDAAHIEAKTYQTIGEPEIRLSIDLAKELLKGAYQYRGLFERLTNMQKPSSS